MQDFLLKIRRGETPFYRLLRDTFRTVRSSTLPLPRLLHPVLRLVFMFQQAFFRSCAFLFTYFIREPLFRSRCESVGKRFHLGRMPFIVGHAKIFIGDDVNFFGKVDVYTGRMLAEPKLVLMDRVDLGHNVVFVVNREIIIEEDVNVASGVRFMDSDAHPRDTMERIADMAPRVEEIKPVRIGRRSWIGQNSFILKGVTIGEGAIIGVNSVVITDIPPYCVAMGNPARVVIKNQPPKPATPEA